MKKIATREHLIMTGLFFVAVGEFLTGSPNDLSLILCGKFTSSIGLGVLLSTTFPEMLDQLELRLCDSS